MLGYNASHRSMSNQKMPHFQVDSLLEKRLQPWKHFLVKKLMRLFGAIADSILCSPRMSLFLCFEAQHIFTSSGVKPRDSTTCLMVVTEFRKIKSCSTSFSSPLMSGKTKPSSLNIFMSLVNPLQRLVAFIFLTVMGFF